MALIRSVFSVLAGYLLFAISAYSIFRLSGRPPHEEAPLLFMAGSSAFGMVFAFLGGYLAARLAGRAPFGHGLAVGIILAAGASVSLAKTMGHGSIWSQLGALLLMAPSAVAGGWTRRRQTASK